MIPKDQEEIGTTKRTMEYWKGQRKSTFQPTNFVKTWLYLVKWIGC